MAKKQNIRKNNQNLIKISIIVHAWFFIPIFKEIPLLIEFLLLYNCQGHNELKEKFKN